MFSRPFWILRLRGVARPRAQDLQRLQRLRQQVRRVEAAPQKRWLVGDLMVVD